MSMSMGSHCCAASAQCSSVHVCFSVSSMSADGYSGKQVREGLYYNPYFPGGAIAMPKMLADEGTEYDDGTVATESQQAKVSLACMATIYMPAHRTLQTVLETRSLHDALHALPACLACPPDLGDAVHASQVCH